MLFRSEMTLDITSITTTGDFSQSHTCGSSLPSLASCTINVTFTPTQVGTRTGAVVITDNAAGSPQMVSLTGLGTVVQLNPSSLTFGAVTAGHWKTLTSIMTNVGNTTLHITSLTITGTYFSETNNCGSSLASHQSCDINVTFAPTGNGNFTGTVSITDDGGGSPQQVSLSGSGTGLRLCRCGGPCNAHCLLQLRCGCYTPSSGALLEEERSSRDLCNANWSDWLPEFREGH